MTLPVAAMMIRKNASVRPTYRCSFTSTGRTEVAVLIAPVLVRLSKQFAPSLTHDTTPARAADKLVSGKRLAPLLGSRVGSGRQTGPALEGSGQHRGVGVTHAVGEVRQSCTI